jgi:F0F1-type ATP synthase epsilon subunit
MKPEQMQVKIYGPFKIYFNGPADSLSATNDTGPFDVLRHHKNFMSLLKSGQVVVRQKGNPDFNMTIDRGILHVRADKVTVFLDV